jgi:hypothetical protein
MGTLRWKLVIVMAACLILPLGGIGFGQEAKTSAESAPERFGMSLREQLESMRWERRETQDLFDVLSSREVAALYRIKALPNPCSRPHRSTKSRNLQTVPTMVKKWDSPRQLVSFLCCCIVIAWGCRIPAEMPPRVTALVRGQLPVIIDNSREHSEGRVKWPYQMW